MPTSEMRASHSLVQKNYPQIAHKLFRPIVDFLVTCHAVCRGDVEKGLILLVVGYRSVQHPEFQSLAPGDIKSLELFPSLGVNVRSIAESTGIPRESVRRKVMEMIDAGWLVRMGRDLRFTGIGYRAVEPAKLQIERLAAEMHWAVASVEGGRTRGADVD